jgi:hypothetical protein
MTLKEMLALGVKLQYLQSTQQTPSNGRSGHVPVARSAGPAVRSPHHF